MCLRAEDAKAEREGEFFRELGRVSKMVELWNKGEVRNRVMRGVGVWKESGLRK